MGSISRAAVAVLFSQVAHAAVMRDEKMPKTLVVRPTSMLSTKETWKRYGIHNKAYTVKPGSVLLGKIKAPESIADEMAEYGEYLIEVAHSSSYTVMLAFGVVILVPIVTIVSYLASKRTAQETMLDGQRTEDDDAETEGLISRAFSTAPTLLEGKLDERIWWYPPPMRMYSRRELLADRLINVMGAILSWIGTPVLLHASFTAGDTKAQFIGFLVFGVGLITMLNFSAMFHSLSCHWNLTRKLLYLDHIGIDAMIMGCYTPVAIHYGSLRILTFVLTLGTLGIFMEIGQFFTGRHKLDGGGDNSKVLFVRIIRYLVMGWSIAVIAPKLGSIASPAVVHLLLGGGCLCTAGVLVFVQNHMEFHLPIWHAFILSASTCFYMVNYLYLVGSPLADLNAALLQ